MTRRTIEQINNDSLLASFVRTKRKALGFTQEEFSLRVGVGIGFLKRLETGDSNLQYSKILQVLSYIGAELVPMDKGENR